MTAEQHPSDKHVFCERCGACLNCDSEDGCFDYEKQQLLPPSEHVRPSDMEILSERLPEA